MNSRKRLVAATVPFLIVGGLLSISTGDANAATLTCTTTTGNTGGTATCKGVGVWRIHLDCAFGLDEVGGWVHQTGGTVKQVASNTCRISNRKTTVERR